MNIKKVIKPVLIVSALMIAAPAHAMNGGKAVGMVAVGLVGALSGYVTHRLFKGNSAPQKHVAPELQEEDEDLPYFVDNGLKYDRTDPGETSRISFNEETETCFYLRDAELDRDETGLNARQKHWRYHINGTVRQEYRQMQAFHYAVSRGDIYTVSEYLEADMLVDEPDGKGYSPLMIAAGNGRADMVNFLLGKKADVQDTNCNGVTALMLAAKKGHTKIVEKLIEHGAMVDAQDNNNSTALMVATLKEQTDVIRALLAHGADMNVTSNRGASALDIAAMLRKSKGSNKTIMPFIKHLAQTQVLNKVAPETLDRVTMFLSMNETLGNLSTNLQVLQTLGIIKQIDADIIRTTLHAEGNIAMLNGVLVNVRQENAKRARQRKIYEDANPLGMAACNIVELFGRDALGSAPIDKISQASVKGLLTYAVKQELEKRVEEYNKMMGRA